MRHLRGVLVRLERPGLAPLAGGHVSEAGIIDFDWRLHNDGPPEILHAHLDGLLDRMRRPPFAA